MSPLWSSKDEISPSEIPNEEVKVTSDEVIIDPVPIVTPVITNQPDTIWNHTTIEVDDANNITRVTIDVPEGEKDRVIIETSIPKAAARISDDLLSFVTTDATEMAKFRSKAIDQKSSVFNYAKIVVSGDLVEVNLDTPEGNDLDQILIRTSVPKAAAMLTDNVAGSLLGATKCYKPFDGKR